MRMKLIDRLRALDTLSRVAIIVLVITLVYILFICFLLPLMTGSGFDEFVFSFRTPEHTHMNLIAFVITIVAGTFTAVWISPQHHGCKERKELMHHMLSADEQRVMDIVEEAGEITQDSLTFRLEWSRPKVSTILTGLERMNLVQRKREGKTYSVFPVKRK